METGKPNHNPWSTILTTLASGDSISKILLVIILLFSGGNFWTGRNIQSEHERDALLAFKQIKVIYNNQQITMAKLGIEPPPRNMVPEKLPEFEDQ